MKTRIWIVLPVLALGLLIWSFFLRQNGVIRHLQAEISELQALNSSQDAEIDALKVSLASVRSAQDATDAKLLSTSTRLAALEAQTNRSRETFVTRPQPKLFLGAPADTGSGDKKRSWGPEQAEGPPDTFVAGDLPTAWASSDPDGGTEWLRLEYANWVEPAEIRVRESFNPGAISKVTAVAADGQEVVIWSGTETPGPAPFEADFSNSQLIVTRIVTVYLDTSRVPGWNEIDAVELIGRDGSHQWAMKATASSTYADRNTQLPSFRLLSNDAMLDTLDAVAPAKP